MKRRFLKKVSENGFIKNRASNNVNAMVDNGEIIKDPQGGMQEAKGNDSPDSVRASLQDGSKILSNTLGVGGKTYADMASNLPDIVRKSQSTINNPNSSKMAKDTAKINMDNANNKFNKLLQMQEDQKKMKSIDDLKNSINSYLNGSSGTIGFDDFKNKYNVNANQQQQQDDLNRWNSLNDKMSNMSWNKGGAEQGSITGNDVYNTLNNNKDYYMSDEYSNLRSNPNFFNAITSRNPNMFTDKHVVNLNDRGSMLTRSNDYDGTNKYNSGQYDTIGLNAVNEMKKAGMSDSDIGFYFSRRQDLAQKPFTSLNINGNSYGPNDNVPSVKAEYTQQQGTANGQDQTLIKIPGYSSDKLEYTDVNGNVISSNGSSTDNLSTEQPQQPVTGQKQVDITQSNDTTQPENTNTAQDTEQAKTPDADTNGYEIKNNTVPIDYNGLKTGFGIDPTNMNYGNYPEYKDLAAYNWDMKMAREPVQYVNEHAYDQNKVQPDSMDPYYQLQENRRTAANTMYSNSMRNGNTSNSAFNSYIANQKSGLDSKVMQAKKQYDNQQLSAADNINNQIESNNIKNRMSVNELNMRSEAKRRDFEGTANSLYSAFNQHRRDDQNKYKADVVKSYIDSLNPSRYMTKEERENAARDFARFGYSPRGFLLWNKSNSNPNNTTTTNGNQSNAISIKTKGDGFSFKSIIGRGKRLIKKTK